MRGPILQALIGVYALLGAKWLIELGIACNRPYCPECGCDLSNAQGGRCPECGVTLPSDVVQVAQRETASGEQPRE